MSAAMDSNTETIYVHLLDEGTIVVRPTQGVPLGEGVYRLLPTSNYDPDTEQWQFPPGSVVRCVWETRERDNILIAQALNDDS